MAYRHLNALALGATIWLAAGADGLRAAALQPQFGLHYYAIENLDDPTETDRLILRGKAGSLGYAHDSIILAPNTRYREWILQARTLQVGVAEYITPGVGQRFTLPEFILRPTPSLDLDDDGLHAEAEFILGTDGENPDTDGDGILDGAEIQQGLDPLGGLVAQTGVIAAADTPGTALDICTLNDLAVVADGAAGVAVFGVSGGLNPVLLTQVDTPGNAQAVACSGTLVAVADGAAGLAVIDLASPSDAVVRHQVSLGGLAQAVTTYGGLAFVGLSNGQLISVDLLSGRVIERLNLGSEVEDVAVEGDTLFALLNYQLRSFAILEGELVSAGSVATSGYQAEGITQRRRLFVGGGEAFATGYPGFDRFDVRNPAAMVRTGSALDRGANSFKQIVANGSGLGLATVGVNPRPDGTHDLYLYNLLPPGETTNLITAFPTPDIARSVALYNGLAYVADSAAGLQIVNYLAFDSLRQPPSITLAASFPLNPAQAEEGKTARLVAQVTDDVQVRNVEFYVDGALVARDGNFPFEQAFLTPLRSAAKTQFTVRAKATDTGGNSAWSAEIAVTLVPDATPPRMKHTFPASGSIAGSVDTVLAYFSEPLDTATLNDAAVSLVSAGADNILFTGDDSIVGGAVRTYRSDQNVVEFRYADVLPPGLYRLVARPPLADLAGNPLAREYDSQFWIVGGIDSDQDGVPDNVEALLGLDPNSADSDGDGLLDGDEDNDGDRLKNSWELLFGLDPRVRDTDGNGVNDDLEDNDNDGLANAGEAARGSSPFSGDTDGDGWDDNGEVLEGTDPTRAASQPAVLVSSRSIFFLNAVPESVPASVTRTVSSLAASYLNALPEPVPAATPLRVDTLPVSYLNALPEPLPANTTIQIGSLPASYLNADPQPFSGPVWLISPGVSYSNQP